MSYQISRRSFIKGTAAAVSLVGVTACQTREVRTPRLIGANDRVNVACIGCGGMGGGDIDGVAGCEGTQIVALCDVDWDRAAGTFRKFPDVPKYKDYRVMLQQMDKDIDAVTISTPDHTHFLPAKMAIEMGKHVYVQKPLSHTIAEARELTLLARKHKVKTQMGNQGHASETTRLMKEWIDADLIGPVTEVLLWTNRPIWPQGMDRPTEVMTPPESLDWNLWLGPAPWRPYHNSYAPFNWRGWWDYGTGALGDMGCHIMDASFYALDLGYPTEVWAESTEVNEESAPVSSIVTYKFPARGNKMPVTVKWYDGQNLPPHPAHLEEDRKIEHGSSGQILIGREASIRAGTYSEGARIIPETMHQALRPAQVERTIPRVPGSNHRQEWIDAIRSGQEDVQAGSSFDYSGPFTEMVLLGNLAIRTGKHLKWDGENMRVTNVAEANQYVSKPYRKFEYTSEQPA